MPGLALNEMISYLKYFPLQLWPCICVMILIMILNIVACIPAISHHAKLLNIAQVSLIYETFVPFHYSSMPIVEKFSMMKEL